MTGAGAIDTRSVRHVRARDRRIVAIVVRSDFDEYDQFPPLQPGADLAARTEKAQLTPDQWPLQVVLMRGHPDDGAAPHYHPLEQASPMPARHQVLICHSGAARVGVFGVDGEPVEDVILRAGDMILLQEGHAVRYLEPKTRVVEIKQGPYPGTDEADRRPLRVAW